MTTMAARTIYPVILSGGAGKRLWPLSTLDFPKQFHDLYSDKPIIVETAMRVQGQGFADPIVICNQTHRFHVATAFQDYDIPLMDIILEPCPRNTAAAIAVAAHYVAEKDANGILLILPSDHYMHEGNDFTDKIRLVAQSCTSDDLITFGIHPTHPETGYGYIHVGDVVDTNTQTGLSKIQNFVEKPNVETAQSYIDDGQYLWNSGLFMGSVGAFSMAFSTHAASIWGDTKLAYNHAKRDLDFLRLDEPSFAKCDNVSFDYAVMEKSNGHALVCPLDMDWNDLGSWSALWDISDKDTNGNAITGDVVSNGNNNCYIRNSNDRSLAVIGLDDVVVVSSQNAVVVAHKNHVQHIRDVFAVMVENNCPSINSAMTRQPWGYSKTTQSGDHFTAKEVVVYPHKKTSTQLHHHRSEHWVVIEGTATIYKDNQIIELPAGQSVSILPNTQHSIENKHDTPLKIFEVQSGDISESDVFRVYVDGVVVKTAKEMVI